MYSIIVGQETTIGWCSLPTFAVAILRASISVSPQQFMFLHKRKLFVWEKKNQFHISLKGE